VIAWFRSSDVRSHSIVEGARIVLAQLSVAPDWVTGTRRIGFNGETTLLNHPLRPVLLLPLTLATVIAWKRGRREILRLAVVTGFLVLIGVLSVARTIGIMYEYRLLWIWVLGMLAAVVIVWGAWIAAAERWRACERRVLIPLSMVALVTLAAVQIVGISTSSSRGLHSSVTERLTKQLSSGLLARSGHVVLRAESPSGEGYLQGLVLGLERSGVDARVRSDPAHRFGAHRVADPGVPETALLVLADEDLGSMPRLGLEVIAYRGTVPLERYPAVASRVEADDQRLLERLLAGTLTPDEYLQELSAVKRPGPSVAVLRERPSWSGPTVEP
jgi:hypothetical protein